MKSSHSILAFCRVAVLIPLAAVSAWADVRLPAFFSDHMVLQRDVTVPVWGWASAGEQVTVSVAGQTKTATADAAGKWSVKLDKLSAGKELTLVVSGKNKITLSDVLVGDVWLCSGQSNMHFQMSRVENASQELAEANHPAVRFFKVEDQFGQEPKSDVKGAWKAISPSTAGGCSAVAFYFGRALQLKLGMPIGLVVSSIGGTRIETWMSRETLAATCESQSLVGRWKDVSPEEFENIATIYRAYQYQRDKVHPQAVKEAREKGEPPPPAPAMPKLRCHDCPSALHNGMIAPLQPFAIRGAIWYQGESNVGQTAPYRKLLPAMISDWRRVWGAEMPFLFVQLAPHRELHPAFREAQLRIWQSTPHTAMVVTTDVGNANDMHPTRKRPVGERLALAARALSYGETVEYSGPVFKSMRVEGPRAVISFTHTGTGLMETVGDLAGFTMAGKDGNFLPAKAVIKGTTVVVTCETIRRPVAVRYGWAMVPEVNLFNREGLPAVPFRTDQPSL
jgi:sialate O-acetylesterase